jgi:asparagine synthase (glutamine-hydrolysing)
MPGILGIFSSDQAPSENKNSFAIMCESLKHTATQKITSYQYTNLLLGRTDLGIFHTNISPKETNDFVAFIWGELLNPQKERKDILKDFCPEDQNIEDLDFLIGLFTKSESDFASHLRGSFNAFILDKQRKTLTIVNDRFGFRPLYYHTCGNELVFSSEVKAILKYKKIKKVVNPAGLADFFHFGFLTGDKTFFNGIEMFPPSVTVTFDGLNLKMKKYWNLVFIENGQNQSEDDYVDQLANVIKDCVKSNVEGEFRFGLPLSGGLDSRTIGACIPREKYPIITYTWGMPNSAEVQIAKNITEKLGLEHHSIYRTPEEFVANFEKSVIMTDGMIPGNLPLANFLFEIAFASHVDICLDGIQSICVVQPIRSTSLTDNHIFEQVVSGTPGEVLKTILADFHYIKFDELAMLSAQGLGESTKAIDPINKYHYLDITQKQRRLDSFGHLVKRNFVEVRTPLFDYPIVDLIQRIPPGLRKQRYIYYKAFCRISPELASVKNVGTMVPVNYPYWLQIAGRIKKGLKSRMYNTLYEKAGIDYNRHNLSDWGIDYESWYHESTAVKNFVKNVLASENIKECEHLNPKGVEQILNAQFTGKKNYADIINRLLTYAIWSKQFLQSS